MPLSFFSLPFELRCMIYQHLFTPADKDKPIAPDVARLRHDQASTPTTIPLRCPALPFIRTCHQAHEEGTNVLYGVNTFRFDDSPYCRRYPPLVFTLSECAAFINPLCEMTYMYRFLSVIGKANRLKIRHLELRFYTDSFITFPGDRNVWNAYCVEDNGTNCRASYISDALDFFSESHCLQSLDLGFFGLFDGVAGFSSCFSKGSRVLQKLAQFKAIEKMTCRVRKLPTGYCLDNAKIAVYQKALVSYQELKVKLAAA